MLKKWVASVLIVTLSFLCLPVFSSAAVYYINVSCVNNFLLYHNPDNVTFLYSGSESFNLNEGNYNFLQDYIDDYKGLSYDFTGICGSLISIDFPSTEFVKDQRYNISFDLSSGVNGNNAALALPTAGGLTISSIELLKMDFEWIQNMNTPLEPWTYVRDYFSVFNNNDSEFFDQCNTQSPLILNSSFSSKHVSYDIVLPADYLSSENTPNTVSLIFLWRSVSPQYMKLENFTITPLGATKFLFDQYQFTEDIKNGILNIEDSIDELQTGISEGLSNIDGSLDELHSNLFEGGTSRDPAIGNKDEINNVLQNEAALNKDFSGDLNQQFDIAGNIFEGNSSFSFISNLFQDMILSVPQLNSLIIFSLAIGLCVLILGRRLNA